MTLTQIKSLWLDISLRASTVLTCAAAGFACALLMRVVNAHFWPDNFAAVGFGTALAMGVLLGIALPELWPSRIPILNLADAATTTTREAQARTAHTALIVGIAMILVASLMAALIASAVIHFSTVLPDRVLLSTPVWRILTLVLPTPIAWPMGIVVGLFLQLVFNAFTKLLCPKMMHSGEPRFQVMLIDAFTCILTGWAAGWILGWAAAATLLLRWGPAMLVVVVLSLAAIVISLTAQHRIDGRSDRRHRNEGSATHDALPELALRPSRSAGLVLAALGWLAVWGGVHWSACWSGWYSPTASKPDSVLLMLLIALPAILLGLRLAKFVMARLPVVLTLVDRQGLALVALGVANLLAIPLTALTLGPALRWLPLANVLTLIVFCCLIILWVVNLAIAIPAVALGRPDRLEVWQHIGRQLVLGALAGAISVGVWQFVATGNLVAVALATIVAIAVSAVALVYHDPLPSGKTSLLRASRTFHLAVLGGLYGILIIVVLITPGFRGLWLTAGNEVVLDHIEAAAGPAYRVISPTVDRVETGVASWPELGDPVARTELDRLLTCILGQTPHAAGSDPSLLLAGFPYLPTLSDLGRPVSELIRVDFHPAIVPMNRAEPQDGWHLGPNYLRTVNRRFDQVVAILPELRKTNSASYYALIVRRLVDLSATNDGVCLIRWNDRAGDGPAAAAEEWNRTSSIPLSRLVLQSSDREWTLYGTSSAMARLADRLGRERSGGFSVRSLVTSTAAVR